MEALFHHLAPIDPANPDIEVIRTILADPDLEGALRYLAGPPVSKDDLGVLVTRRSERVTKRAISADPALAKDILQLICRLADAERFPWLSRSRKPRRYEIKQAMRATVAMHAAQSMRTERAAFGKVVESRLRERLLQMNFLLKPTPNKGRVTAPIHIPPPKCFYGECNLQGSEGGRRADLLIGLPDGRAVAVEAKDSSSVVNSVKRVLNDTAAKARQWQNRWGDTVIAVALLSGVFGIENLRSAQASGLFLVWSHDLDSFADWLLAQ